MPDKRTRRGPAPQDPKAFHPSRIASLRTACDELSWLLTRGYSARAGLKLVGDRHRLTERQRKALQRTAASDQAASRRSSKRVAPADLQGTSLEIDGYNVLLTVEAALSGGLLLLARDGTLRDLSALSRHYKRLGVTIPALRHIGIWLDTHDVGQVKWWLDSPISNSGRLAEILSREATEHGWPWEVELVGNPDAVLLSSQHVVATADSAILDRCGHWLNLARHVVHDRIAASEGVWCIDLSAAASAEAP